MTLDAQGADAMWQILGDQIFGAGGLRAELVRQRALYLRPGPGVETLMALAPMIDPELNRFGTEAPHDAAAQRHPEPGLCVTGVKVDGWQPPLVLLTGRERGRPVVNGIAACGCAQPAPVPDRACCSAAT